MSSWAFARLSTAMAKKTLSSVSVVGGVKEMAGQQARKLTVCREEGGVERWKVGGKGGNKKGRHKSSSKLHHCRGRRLSSSICVFSLRIFFTSRHIVHLCEHEGRIQLPKSVRTMKKMEKTIPLSFTPPWDSMPSYITMFQSSPVRIYRERTSGQRDFLTKNMVKD